MHVFVIKIGYFIHVLVIGLTKGILAMVDTPFTTKDTAVIVVIIDNTRLKLVNYTMDEAEYPFLNPSRTINNQVVTVVSTLVAVNT